MKPLSLRRLLIFFLCVFYALLLSCCSENGSQETIHPVIAELMATLPKSDAEPLPDEVISESDICKIYRKNGHCYVDYKAGNEGKFLYQEGKLVSPPVYIEFKTVEAMYQWLTSATALGNYQSVNSTFLLDEDNGFLLPDPDRLYTIQVPDQYEPFCVRLYGNGYVVVYRTREKTDNFVISISFLDEPWFMERLGMFCRFETGEIAYDACYSIAGRDATVYEWEAPSGRFRDIHYSLQTDSRIVFVEESYRLTSNDSTPIREDGLPYLTILGCDRGIFFALEVSTMDPSELPTLLESIKIVEFEGTTN